MGFDDLARHMASRDGKKKLAVPAASADDLAAEIAKADRRLTRTRNLILGPVLMVCGAVILIVYGRYLLDVTHPTPNPQRPRGDGWFVYSIGLTFTAIAMVIIGCQQLIRGLKAVRRDPR